MNTSAASGRVFPLVGRWRILDVLTCRGFSAARKPIRTVQAEASRHPSARSFIFSSISSAALPLHVRLVFLLHSPSLPPLLSFPLPSFLPPSLHLAPALLSAVLQISSIILCIIPSPKGRVSPIVISTVRLYLVAPSLN